MSPSQSAREVEDEIDEEHRNNPLFRSDAFDQIPSQNKQLSQNTYGQQRIPTGDITANTDQNLNENFKNDTTYGQDKSQSLYQNNPSSDFKHQNYYPQQNKVTT